MLKLLVLGDPATGKTSIIKRYVDNFFSNHHRSTIGVDFSWKQMTVNKTNCSMNLYIVKVRMAAVF